MAFLQIITLESGYQYILDQILLRFKNMKYKERGNGSWKLVHRNPKSDEKNISPYILFDAPGFKDIGFLQLRAQPGYLKVFFIPKYERMKISRMARFYLFSEFVNYLNINHKDLIKQIQFDC